jgi:hypothetical protein
MDGTRAVAIWEGRANEWKVEGLNGYRLNQTVSTASDALRLVELEDQRTEIVTGKPVKTTVNWHTRTGIGRMEVGAITGKGER